MIEFVYKGDKMIDILIDIIDMIDLALDRVERAVLRFNKIIL